VKVILCFETKKAAKPVHAANGIPGKKGRLPSMDKGVAGATLELRCALTCLKAMVPTAIHTETLISTETAISMDTANSTATTSMDTEISTAIQWTEKSIAFSENVITNTGKTPIAVKIAVFILFSNTT